MHDAAPIPRSLGEHDVVRRIGKGAMGVVLEVRSRESGAVRAAKLVLRSGHATSRARFRREAELLARCDRHPGVVKVHSFGETPEGALYLVMDLVSGEGLDRLLDREPRLPARRAAELARDIALALGHVHGLGVVHRDVKPSNVLLDEEGRPKLGDFGLATAADLDSLTRSGVFIGTPLYCAPEQAGTDGDVGPAADVYALGCLLYRLLAGAAPYEHFTTQAAVVTALREPAELPSVRLREPSVPEPLAAIVARAVRKAPRERYATGAELAADLSRFLAGERTTAEGEVAARRSRSLVGLAAGAVVSVALVGGWIAASRPGGEPGAGTGGLVATNVLRVLLEEPRDGVASVATRILVRGRLEPPGTSATVTVNGARADRRGDHFEAWVPASGESQEIAVDALEGTRHAAARARVPLAAPAWFVALAKDARPEYPLVPELTFGGPGEYVNRKDGSVLVWVPEGRFVMGSAEVQKELDALLTSVTGVAPAHSVRLSGYFVGKYETTVRQFRAFVRATRYRTTAEERLAGEVGTIDGFEPAQHGVTWEHPDRQGLSPPEDEPVCQVSWLDARAYVAWAGLELPTEAQWEKAAVWDPAAGRARRYSWGDAVPSPETGLVCNCRDESSLRGAPETARVGRFFQGYDDGFKMRAPVGSFPLGASCYGALDMIGNVAEWCQDSFDDHFYERTEDALDPVREVEGGRRGFRGGSWINHPWYLMGATRQRAPEDYRTNYVGFRVARRER